MKIICTDQARHTYDMTIAYLLEKWTIKEAKNFIDSVSSMKERLKNSPIYSKVNEAELIQ